MNQTFIVRSMVSASTLCNRRSNFVSAVSAKPLRSGIKSFIIIAMMLNVLISTHSWPLLVAAPFQIRAMSTNVTQLEITTKNKENAVMVRFCLSSPIINGLYLTFPFWRITRSFVLITCYLTLPTFNCAGLLKDILPLLFWGQVLVSAFGCFCKGCGTWQTRWWCRDPSRAARVDRSAHCPTSFHRRPAYWRLRRYFGVLPERATQGDPWRRWHSYLNQRIGRFRFLCCASNQVLIGAVFCPSCTIVNKRQTNVNIRNNNASYRILLPREEIWVVPQSSTNSGKPFVQDIGRDKELFRADRPHISKALHVLEQVHSYTLAKVFLRPKLRSLLHRYFSCKIVSWWII